MQKLYDLVNKSIEEENLLSSRLLQDEEGEKATLGERWADRIAEFGGSWTFIFGFLITGFTQ